jgi:hypothetical protein
LSSRRKAAHQDSKQELIMVDYDPQRMVVLKLLEEKKRKEITIDEIPDEFKIFSVKTQKKQTVK